VYYCLNRGTLKRGLSLEQFLDAAALAGFEGADVDMDFALREGVDKLQEMYTLRSLRYGGWGPPDWRNELDKAKDGLEMLKKFAVIAKEIDADSCCTYIMPSSDRRFMENWRFHIERLKPVAWTLAEQGLRLGLEFVAPHHLRKHGEHEFIFTPGQMLELAADVGPNVGLLIDCFHVYCSGVSMKTIGVLPRERIVLVHLNDAPKGVDVPDVKDGERVLPGEGAIDLVDFVREIDATGYEGPCSVEVFSESLRAMDERAAAKLAWDATRRSMGVDRGPAVR
jgi:sugar phosphate isomerase/epimerase